VGGVVGDDCLVQDDGEQPDQTGLSGAFSEQFAEFLDDREADGSVPWSEALPRTADPFPVREEVQQRRSLRYLGWPSGRVLLWLGGDHGEGLCWASRHT